jgi:hypothetical protein
MTTRVINDDPAFFKIKMEQLRSVGCTVAQKLTKSHILYNVNKV